MPGPITVYNTVGEIKGTKKPDEFVVLGAHIDSWDLASGTTDNGTGTTIVLEVARILQQCGIKPERTIRFVLFSGEAGLSAPRPTLISQGRNARLDMPGPDTGTGKVTGIGCKNAKS